MLLVRSLSFLTSGAWRHGGRRVNWARVAGVIYDKFDGEFASRDAQQHALGIDEVSARLLYSGRRVPFR